MKNIILLPSVVIATWYGWGVIELGIKMLRSKDKMTTENTSLFIKNLLLTCVWSAVTIFLLEKLY